jgi:hypothetical protein
VTQEILAGRVIIGCRSREATIRSNDQTHFSEPLGVLVWAVIKANPLIESVGALVFPLGEDVSDCVRMVLSS